MGKYIVKAERHRHVVTEGKKTTATRYFRGDVITLDDDKAAALVATGGLAPYVEPEVEDESEPEAPALPSTPATLEAASGNTADPTLQEAVRDAALHPGASETPEPSEGLGGTSGDAGDGYEALSYGALQDEAQKRGLSATGSKAVLIERLREHDNA